MKELVELISQKTDLSEEVARKTVIITADYLKTKLTSPFAMQLEAILDLHDVSEDELNELGLFKIP